MTMLVHRIRSLLSVGVVLLAGGFATALPASAAPHRSQPRGHHPRRRPPHRVHHRHESGGIPQHNGGDHDGDNNGAPSDSDGNQ